MIKSDIYPKLNDNKQFIKFVWLTKKILMKQFVNKNYNLLTNNS